MESHKLDNKNALEFIFAGNARFTFLNANTGNRYTYRVKKHKTVEDLFFVSILNGPNNEDNYNFIGSVRNSTYKHSAKSSATEDAVSVKVFTYVLTHLVKGDLPSFIEIWHEGTCGRCNRALTVPSSIENGIGPECARIIVKSHKH